VFKAYADSYDKGYQEGLRTAKGLTLTGLRISPGGFTMGAHTQRKLTATATLSNKTEKDVSGEVRWLSSDEKVVKVIVNGGVATALLVGMGRAEITASYQGVHGSGTSKIVVVVNPPVIEVSPPSATMHVGEKRQFRAVSADKATEPMSDYLDAGV